MDLVAVGLRQQVETVVAELEVASVVACFEGAPDVVESIDGAVTVLHHYGRTIY